jgi:ParB-like chromosome segregation protein Spo0J
MSSDTNPLGLDLIDDVTGYAPRHDVTDEDKADQLAADMAERGWQGAPLVVLRDYAQALTGVHRLAAAEKAGIAVPAVDAEELLAACGIDLWERRETDLADLELDEVLETLLSETTTEIQTAYGLDLR